MGIQIRSFFNFFGAAAIAPVIVLLVLALLAAFYVFIWPADYLLLSGHNATSALSESFRFMRQHWEVIIAFDIGRLFILFFSAIVASIVGVSSLIPSFGSLLSDVMAFMNFGSNSSVLTAFLSIIVFLFILIFLILMRAVAFTMLYEEGQAEQALASIEGVGDSQPPSYPSPSVVSPPAQEPPDGGGYQA